MFGNSCFDVVPVLPRLGSRAPVAGSRFPPLCTVRAMVPARGSTTQLSSDMDDKERMDVERMKLLELQKLLCFDFFYFVI